MELRYCPKCAGRKEGVTSCSQSVNPCWTFPLSCLFWGCTGRCGEQGHGVAVTEPGVMISDWWIPQDSRRPRCFPLALQPWNRSHILMKRSQLFLLPDSVTTPISSPWRRVCRTTTTTTGMMPSSDFSNVLVETELFPLTGSQKSPAGKKRVT